MSLAYAIGYTTGILFILLVLLGIIYLNILLITAIIKALRGKRKCYNDSSKEELKAD